MRSYYTVKTRVASLFVAALAMGACASQAGAADTALASDAVARDHETIIFATHGETTLAQKQPDGSIKGVATDLLDCAVPGMGLTYSWTHAPLSRASQLVESDKRIVWYPSKFEGDAERMSRLVGPAGELNFYWHVMKNSPLVPGSEAFREQARITTYSGSRQEKWLQQNGYRFIPGSAKPERLVYQLLSGEVDGVLSVDLTANMSQSMRNQLEVKTRRVVQSIGVTAFEVSRGMQKHDPEFVAKFQSAIDRCNTK